jgi:hypothetical protein
VFIKILPVLNIGCPHMHNCTVRSEWLLVADWRLLNSLLANDR